MIFYRNVHKNPGEGRNQQWLYVIQELYVYVILLRHRRLEGVHDALDLMENVDKYTAVRRVPRHT